MKILLRITILLLLATVIAGAFSLSVRDTSGSAGNGGISAGLSEGNNQAGGLRQNQPADGGGHENVSVSMGLAEMLTTLVKLSSVTAIILLAQKGLSLLLNKCSPKTAQA